MGDRLVDPRVQAEGQAIALAVDGIEQRVEIVAAVAQHVQHRPEHLALAIVERGDLDQRRRDEGAGRRRLGQGQGRDASPGSALGLDVGQDAVPRFRRDDGADIGRQAIGIGDHEFRHGALEHGENAVGDILLQAQHTQRRTALSRRVEGGHDHVAHHLFGERGGIDDQGILPARLGNQRNGPAVDTEAAGRAGAGSGGRRRSSR